VLQRYVRSYYPLFLLILLTSAFVAFSLAAEYDMELKYRIAFHEFYRDHIKVFSPFCRALQSLALNFLRFRSICSSSSAWTVWYSVTPLAATIAVPLTLS
jgi:hypothetical protein